MTQSTRVLVVDDEPQICHNCLKILTKDKYHVQCAYNGQDALALFSEAPYDVVVTDLKMNRLGGMELLRRVKSMAPDTMVIVITGYSTVSSAVEVMKLGAFDYLPKPFTSSELTAVLEKAIEKRDRILKNRQRDKSETVSEGFSGIIGKGPTQYTKKVLVRKSFTPFSTHQ